MEVAPLEFLKVVRPALESGDASRLAEEVSRRWTPRQLCRLLGHTDREVRRVTAVTLGLVGDASCVGCLARALHDPDDGVNEMAEHGLWSIWFRAGSPKASGLFSEGVNLLCAEAYEDAVEKFEQAAEIDPDFAEAHNQAAIGRFFLGLWHESIASSERTLAIIPAHFGAMSGMGHCYAQLGDFREAARCYQRALAINPRMKAIARALQQIRACDKTASEGSGVFEAVRSRR